MREIKDLKTEGISLLITIAFIAFMVLFVLK